MKILAFSLLVLFFQSYAFAQQKYKKSRFKGALVEVVEVKKTQLYSFTPVFGRIISLEPYAIISKVNEEIKKIFVLEGTDVTKGQKILEFENKNIQRIISRYKEEIKFNKKTLKLLNEEILIINDKLSRFLKLRNSKVISNDLYDDLRIKKINLIKQVSKIEFLLKKLSYLLLSSEEDLINSIIRSPIDGNLIEFNAQLGSILKKGSKIGSVLNPKKNEIEAFIKSDLASKLKPGYPAQIANNSQIINTEIRAIIAVENLKTGSRLLKINIPTIFPLKLNFPNKRIELKIPINDGKEKLIIPKDGLIADGDKKLVYVIKNNKATRRNVILGQSFKDQIEIKFGLEEGELVIVKGNENIRQNQFVKIQKQK